QTDGRPSGNAPWMGAQGVMDMNSVQNEGVSTAATAAWYLVHCKPRQDERAQEHLIRQGYDCYRPLLRRERLVRGRTQTVLESLFPGYLFVQLHPTFHPRRESPGQLRRLPA